MPVDSLSLSTHTYLVQHAKFLVEKRYRITEPITHGAHGIVVQADDEETDAKVAIKKIEAVFEHVTFTKRTLRELRILRHLQHENLLALKSVFFVGVKADFKDFYVVSELMETDLCSTLKSQQTLSDDHCQFILYQILRGMKYVHSAQVIHRDLKSRSCLLNSQCEVKICDFGLARVKFSERDWTSPMTEYVSTRWYRAPEVLCSWADYTDAIDVWSIGCIFAEMYLREPILPGKNTQHQLDILINLLGSPDDRELDEIQNEKCKKFIYSLPRPQEKPDWYPFMEVFATMESPTARELLTKLMKWDPKERLSVGAAIKEPYLQAWHCDEDEPIRSPLDTSHFEFERRKVNAGVWREELFREALCYYPELQAEFEQELAAGGSTYNITDYRLLQRGEDPYSSDEDDDDD